MGKAQSTIKSGNEDLSSILLGEAGQRLIKRLLYVLTIGTIVGIVVNVSHGKGNLAVLIVTLMLGFLNLALMHMGHIRVVVMILLWSCALFPSISGMSHYGIDAPALFFVPVVVMAASWLLSVKQCTVICIVCIITYAINYKLIANGTIVPVAPIPFLRWITLGGILLMSSLMGRIGAQALRTEFGRVQNLAFALSQKAEQLQRSEAGFSALFRSNPLPSLTGDFNGVVLDVNDSWLTTFGYLRENVVGRPIAGIGMLRNAEDFRTVRQVIEEKGSMVGMEVQLRVANRSRRTFLLSVSCFELADGWRYVASLIDQTDRVAAEQMQHLLNVELENRVATRTSQLSHAVDELKRTQTQLVQSEKLASLGSMVAGVAHEINTPVGNAIMLTSSLAEQQREFESALVNGISRTKVNQFLGSVHEVTDLVGVNMRRVAQLVNSFKAVAVNQTSERPEVFDLQEMMEQIIIGFKLGTTAFPVCNRVPVGIQMHSFPLSLAEVLTSLIDNSIKHGFEGREEGQILLQAELLADDRVRIIFSDDGVGVAEQYVKRIFEPFFTTKPHQARCGLGLTIAHNIVMVMLGGTIEVRSRADSAASPDPLACAGALCGTVFYIEIPRAVAGELH